MWAKRSDWVSTPLHYCEAAPFPSLLSQVPRACLVTQSYLTLCDPMDRSLPGSSAHGILQAKTLQWVAFPFFQIQGSNPSLLHWRQILYRLSQQGSPIPGPASWQISTGHPNACFQGRPPKVPWEIRRASSSHQGALNVRNIQPVLHDCVSLSMRLSLGLYSRGHSLASMATQDRRTRNFIHRRKKLGVDPDEEVPGQSRAPSRWAWEGGGSSLVAGVGKASNHFEH